jgi:hypothetical protein
MAKAGAAPGERYPLPECIEQPKVLYVEGWDEVKLYGALLKHMGLGEIQPITFSGSGSRPEKMKALTDHPNFGRVAVLGVVTDAEGDAARAFQSVRTALQTAALPVPPDMGIWHSAQTPKVGVFIQPDNASTGMLETLCLMAVGSDPTLECVGAFLQCARNAGKCIAPKDEDRAKAHAYLAVCPKPGLRVGEAAEAGYWDFGSPVWEAPKRFLRSM